MKRFITLALIVVMLFSCVACKGKTKGDEEFQFTSYDLVKDGASDYSVLVPANADENALYAASELIWFSAKQRALRSVYCATTAVTTKIQSVYRSAKRRFSSRRTWRWIWTRSNGTVTASFAKKAICL